MRGSEACKGIVVFYFFLFEGFVLWGGREERIPGLEAFFQPRLGAPVSKTEARGSQEEPGGARGSQEETGGARRSQVKGASNFRRIFGPRKGRRRLKENLVRH